jgi:hypothetical protein
MWLDARTSYVAGAVKLLRSANKYPTVISFSLRNNDDVVLDVLGNGKLTAPHSYAVKRFDGKQ